MVHPGGRASRPPSLHVVQKWEPPGLALLEENPGRENLERQEQGPWETVVNKPSWGQLQVPTQGAKEMGASR